MPLFPIVLDITPKVYAVIRYRDMQLRLSASCWPMSTSAPPSFPVLVQRRRHRRESYGSSRTSRGHSAASPSADIRRRAWKSTSAVTTSPATSGSVTWPPWPVSSDCERYRIGPSVGRNISRSAPRWTSRRLSASRRCPDHVQLSRQYDWTSSVSTSGSCMFYQFDLIAICTAIVRVELYKILSSRNAFDIVQIRDAPKGSAEVPVQPNIGRFCFSSVRPKQWPNRQQNLYSLNWIFVKPS